MQGKAPRTVRFPWSPVVLLSGVLILLLSLIGWVSTAPSGLSTIGLGVAVFGGGLTLVGIAATVHDRSRARQGLGGVNGEASRFALPSMIVCLAIALAAAVWPFPMAADWLSFVVLAFALGGALWMGLKLAQNGTPVSYRQASRAYRDGDLDEALKHLSTCERERPDYVGCVYLSALIASDQGRYDDSHSEAERLVRARPDLYYGHAQLGLTLLGRGCAAEALPHLRTAASIAPYLAQSHYNLGMACFEASEEDEALCSLGRALWLRLGDEITEISARYHVMVLEDRAGLVQAATRERRRLRRKRRVLAGWGAGLRDGNVSAAQKRRDRALIAKIERAIAL